MSVRPARPCRHLPRMSMLDFLNSMMPMRATLAGMLHETNALRLMTQVRLLGKSLTALRTLTPRSAYHRNRALMGESSRHSERG